jgi:hypothetical protein
MPSQQEKSKSSLPDPEIKTLCAMLCLAKRQDDDSYETSRTLSSQESEMTRIQMSLIEQAQRELESDQK